MIIVQRKCFRIALFPDMGKETSINVSLEGNVSYVVYNSDDGWKSYEGNIQFSVRDMLTQFLNSGKKFAKIRYTVMVLYKYSVNLISNRNEKEAIEAATDIANKLNSKYKNLHIGEVQSGFFGLNSMEPIAFVEIYKDL